VIDDDGRLTTVNDVIEQPASVDDAVPRLSLAFGRMTRLLRRGMPTGLGPGSLSALATIVRTGPLRLGDLAAREGIAPPTLTRIIAALEEAGYVRREPDPTDGRAIRVRATGGAEDLINGAGSHRAHVLRERLEALSPDDLEILLRAVPVLESLAADEQ
jgi:DNA-binding MarR family transcriptional regulator